MAFEDFDKKLDAFKSNPTPTYEPMFQTADEGRGFWGTVADFGKEIFVKPAQELGRDIAELTPEVKAARQAIEQLRATDPKLAAQLESDLGQKPTLKKVLGDVGEVGLTIASVIPGVGLAKLGSAAKAAKVVKAGSAAEKLLVTGKAAPFVRTALEGGMWGSGYMAAEAAQQNKSVEDIIKEAGKGYIVGAAAAPILTGVFALSKAGLGKVASLSPVNKITSAIAESDPGKFIRRFVSRTGEVLSKDFNMRNLVDAYKTADRNTQAGIARVLAVFQDDVPFKVNKRTMEGAQAAYEFGRGKYPTVVEDKGVKAAAALTDDEIRATQTATQNALRNQGVTISINGEVPTAGFSMSPYKQREFKVSADDFNKDPEGSIKLFTQKNKDKLSEADHYIGGWYNPEDKTWYWDVSVVKQNQDEAMRFAADADQLAIWDIAGGKSVDVKKLGLGEVTGIIKPGEKAIGFGTQEALTPETAQTIRNTSGVRERWNAFYNDFAETARQMKLQVKSVDPKTGKVMFKPFPAASELTQKYRPKVFADPDRLAKDEIYKEFAARQMVDDWKDGLSKWHFESVEDAKAFIDDWLHFLKTNGVGAGKNDLVVKAMVRSGQAETPEAALRMLNEYRKNIGKVKLGSYLEFERQFDFPIYNPFPDETLVTYAMDSLKRIEMINQFGYKLEDTSVRYPVIDKAVEKIRKSYGRGSDEAKIFDEFVNVVMERVPKGTWKDKASYFFRVLGIPKLTFAQIVNSGQGFLNGLLATDTRSVFKGLARSFTKKGREEALLSGASTQQLINDSLRVFSGGSEAASTWLRATGYIWTERWNRTWAANTFKNWAEHNYKKLLKNPTDRYARASLAELGINVDKALARGKMTQAEILTAMQTGAEKTQFRSRPIDLPWWSSSPAGKVFWQFKNFAYQQTTFLKDELAKNLSTGNYGRAVRMFVVLSTIFPMTAEVLQDVRSLVTQSRRPTKALDRYLADIAGSGAMAIVGDMIQSSRYGQLEFAAPSISSLTEIIQSTIQNVDDPEKIIDTLLRQSGIGTPIANVLMPPAKRKGRETMLQTIQRAGGF